MGRTWALTASLLCGVLCAVGCGGGVMQRASTPAAISVTVTPATATVGSGQAAPFVATVTGDNTGVNWAVNGTTGGSSTTGTIDANGNYTAPAVTTNTTATITAVSKADTSKSASAAVTVIAPGVVASTANVQVASYTITPPSGADCKHSIWPGHKLRAQHLAAARPVQPGAGDNPGGRDETKQHLSHARGYNPCRRQHL